MARQLYVETINSCILVCGDKGWTAEGEIRGAVHRGRLWKIQFAVMKRSINFVFPPQCIKILLDRQVRDLRKVRKAEETKMYHGRTGEEESKIHSSITASSTVPDFQGIPPEMSSVGRLQ